MLYTALPGSHCGADDKDLKGAAGAWKNLSLNLHTRVVRN